MAASLVDSSLNLQISLKSIYGEENDCLSGYGPYYVCHSGWMSVLTKICSISHDCAGAFATGKRCMRKVRNTNWQRGLRKRKMSSTVAIFVR